MRSKSGGGSSKARRRDRRQSEKGYTSRWWCCRVQGGPRRGCPHSAAGLLSFSSGRGGGGEGRGSIPRGPGGRAARVRAPLLPRAALTVGAVNRPITARGEPTGPAPPASSPGLRGGRARGVSGAGAGRSRRGRPSGPGCAVGGRAGCGDGAGLGGGKGPTRRRGCPGKFDFNSGRVGGGSEVGPGWAAGRGWGTPVRRRLFWGPRGARPELGSSRSRWAPGLIVTHFE